MNDTIEIAAASVLGRDHRRVDRPCQDAFAIRRRDDRVVAVVSDGCGSGAHSELGARLGANAMAAALVASPEDWDGACDAVLAQLAALVPALGDDPAAAISQHLLFTLLAVVVTRDRAAVMAIGDGVVIVDGTVLVLDAGPDNAPPYLAYELLGQTPERRRIAADDARSIVLATDGAVPILADLTPELGWDDPVRRGMPCEVEERRSSLPGVMDTKRRMATKRSRGRQSPTGQHSRTLGLSLDDRAYRHPDALRRRLAIAGREPGLLMDDTTVVALRRRAS